MNRIKFQKYITSKARKTKKQKNIINNFKIYVT